MDRFEDWTERHWLATFLFLLVFGWPVLVGALAVVVYAYACVIDACELAGRLLFGT